MTEYVQPSDDDLHALMHKFFRNQPQTICTIRRQDDTETKSKNDLEDHELSTSGLSIKPSMDGLSNDVHEAHEPLSDAHDVHDAHGPEGDAHDVQDDVHDAVEHTIVHVPQDIVPHPYDAFLPVHVRACPDDPSLNTVVMPPQDASDHHEPSPLPLQRGVSFYEPSSCDVL